jgi:hypothetical protein
MENMWTCIFTLDLLDVSAHEYGTGKGGRQIRLAGSKPHVHFNIRRCIYDTYKT